MSITRLVAIAETMVGLGCTIIELENRGYGPEDSKVQDLVQAFKGECSSMKKQLNNINEHLRKYRIIEGEVTGDA